MLSRNILDNPFVVFFVCLVICVLNLFLSIQFLPIMFAGVIFILFLKMIDNSYYYSLIWVLIAFLVIENTQGFKSFSLISIAVFIYIFVKPNIERIFSSFEILKIIYVIIFYLFIAIMYIFTNSLNLDLLYIALSNILIDAIIIGVFI